MRNDKRRRLEAAGWRVEDSPQDFLGLSEREMCLVDMKVSLAIALRHRRAAANISQVELAGTLGSSQSRVAKMEAADPSVSADLLMRALLALGTQPHEIGAALGSAQLPAKGGGGRATGTGRWLTTE